MLDGHLCGGCHRDLAGQKLPGCGSGASRAFFFPDGQNCSFRQDQRWRFGAVYNIIGTFCSPNLEYLAVKCRPLKLVGELSSIVILATYVPP